jgi:hypothetical protein
MLYFAKWETVESTLHNHPCIITTYLHHDLESYEIDPHFISGLITFSTIYNLGLPLLNGIISGVGPWPMFRYKDQFSLKGPGSIMVFETTRDPQILPWNVTSPINKGNGFQITYSSKGRRSVNFMVKVLYPTVGIKDVDFNTDWGIQSCHIYGFLGRVNMSVLYHVDEWQMVTSGSFESIDFIDHHIVHGESGHLGASQIIKFLQHDEAIYGNYYDFTSNTSEGHLLISSIYKSLSILLNNTWYLPSKAVKFSNMMQWATLHDGYYYANMTSKGLASALAASTYELLMQFDESKTNVCEFFGETGEGKTVFHPLVLNLLNAFLGIFFLMTTFRVLVFYFMCPVRKADINLFKKGCLIMKNELYRIFYSSLWISKYQENSSNIQKNISLAQNIPIRFGKTMSSMDCDEPVLCIGPARSTVVLKNRNLEDLIHLNESQS